MQFLQLPQYQKKFPLEPRTSYRQKIHQDRFYPFPFFLALPFRWLFLQLLPKEVSDSQGSIICLGNGCLGKSEVLFLLIYRLRLRTDQVTRNVFHDRRLPFQMQTVGKMLGGSPEYEDGQCWIFMMNLLMLDLCLFS